MNGRPYCSLQCRRFQGRHAMHSVGGGEALRDDPNSGCEGD